jgi:hypothetical protein
MVTGYLLDQFILANKAHIPALPHPAVIEGLIDDVDIEPRVSLPFFFSLISAEELCLILRALSTC